MVINLSREMLNVLLDEVDGALRLVDEQRMLKNDTYELEVSDINELQLLINDEILYRGLDNQNELNNLGKKLYELYDNITSQKNNG